MPFEHLNAIRHMFCILLFMILFRSKTFDGRTATVTSKTIHISNNRVNKLLINIMSYKSALNFGSKYNVSDNAWLALLLESIEASRVTDT